ncbi:KxYKxGKxW signal peptide domain-containing protein [Leuconostoc lactis]|uniref:KxYKxGKxW signal peptide domain-containing protein n=1 Tax=Leuconostoc lactis TaxID=1246 RepID=UPI00272CB301|nr:KxYKxGKxW signal peptide domain-containing protein [Leuconostoc lactis]WKY78467.1 KxYKxGKxW signal peptide domain-containing protein [Leuconostoc lactis]
MLKKYKLYKSGKMLVTGAFITGVVALTSVSQVNADTVTESQDAQPKVALNSKASDESNLPSAKQNQTNSVNTVETKDVSANTTNATTNSTLPAQETLDSNTTNVQVVPDKSSTNNTNVSATPVTSTTQQADNVTKEISTPDITIQGHGQDYGWQKPMHENQTVGVTEQSKRLEAIKISVTNADKTYQGDVIYQAHLAGTGWQQEVKNGELAGTVHQGRQIEAIKIRLTG